jgi:nucleoside-diphosphate-sugar epimerase
MTATALVAGVSGIAGRGIATRLIAEGWEVVGLSRTAPNPAIVGLTHVSADLRDPASIAAALQDIGHQVTHIFYVGRAPDPDPVVEAAGNLAMLVNTVEAVRAAGATLAHVHAVHGGKWYGSHLGPYRTPAAEDDPRPAQANFYYDQQDWLEMAAPKAGFTWSTTRPHVLTGFSLGYPHNIASVIAVHAALCRAEGRPLTFPGSQGCFESISQVTDVRLLVEAVLWCATEPAAAGQAFNVINADYFRWMNVWPRLADSLGMEAGGVETENLDERFAVAAGQWRDLAERHGLIVADIARIASGAYGDATLSVWWDDMCSTAKLRKAGFGAGRDPVFTSGESLIDALAAYRRHRVVP